MHKMCPKHHTNTYKLLRLYTNSQSIYGPQDESRGSSSNDKRLTRGTLFTAWWLWTEVPLSFDECIPFHVGISYFSLGTGFVLFYKKNKKNSWNSRGPLRWLGLPSLPISYNNWHTNLLSLKRFGEHYLLEMSNGALHWHIAKKYQNAGTRHGHRVWNIEMLRNIKSRFLSNIFIKVITKSTQRNSTRLILHI